MKLIEELQSYPTVLSLFKLYIVEVLKIDAEKFTKEAPNTTIIPQLVLFLEAKYQIDMIDLICFVNANVQGFVPFNELLKKSIKVVFHMIEHKRQLNFIPY